ncbi:MAG: hypothetical protein V1882_07625 [Candidatus Omnitrophota bacterium]
MRLILRKKAHRRLLRIYRALGKEIRCLGRMRFGKTMATLDVMQERLIRRDSWEEKKRGKA